MKRAGALPMLVAFLASQLIGTALGAEPQQVRQLAYCIPLNKINLSPFEDLGEPVRLFYLLVMTRSFISTDASEPGVLSQWQFSPDGRTFTARVSPDTRWQDGSRVSSREAAYSIAKGLSVHPIGERIRVEGTAAINQPGWTKRIYSGVKIIDDATFELRFESTVVNTAGVVREALSTNARGNRVWVARLVEGNPAQQEIVSKFPYRWDGNAIIVDTGSAAIKIYPGGSDCTASDFKIYGLPEGEEKQFTAFSSHGQQALIGVINPIGKLGERSRRLELAQWLRQTFTKNSLFGFNVLRSHFARMETGYSDAIDWGLSDRAPKLGKLLVTKGTSYTQNSPVVTSISRAAKAAGIAVTFVDRRDRTDQGMEEVIVGGARIEGDRQLWMQDHLNDNLFKDVMPRYPKSYAALAEVARKSSSTIPLDRATLEGLDRALFEEAAIIPLGRYRVTVFSRSTTPVELIYTSHDEMTFKLRSGK